MNNSSITAIVKVTDNCNLKCPYCYEEHRKKSKALMKPEVFKRIVQQLTTKYNGGKVQLIFHGGEALLAPYEWFEEAVKNIKTYARLNNCDVTIGAQSNGSFIKDDVLKLFKNNGVTVGFSFDGLCHDTTRCNTSKFILNTRHSNKATNGKYENSGNIFIVTNDNMDTLIENILYFDQLKMDSVMMNLVYETEDTDHHLESMPIVKRYAEAFKYYLECAHLDVKVSQFNTFMNLALDLKGYQVQQNALCNNRINCLGRWMGILTNGDVLPCGGGWHEKYKIGNIMEQDVDDIMMSKEMFNISKLQGKYIAECKAKNCELYDVCFGDCPERNSFVDFKHGKNIQCISKRLCVKIANDYLENKFHKIKNKHILHMLSGVCYVRNN